MANKNYFVASVDVQVTIRELISPHIFRRQSSALIDLKCVINRNRKIDSTLSLLRYWECIPNPLRMLSIKTLKTLER